MTEATQQQQQQQQEYIGIPWWLSGKEFSCQLMRLTEKAMATHFSVLAGRIPGTGEPGGLPSMGSHRVGHD